MTPSNDACDFVTIIGSDVADITRQFRAQGLAEANYTIVHRIGRHRFTVVEGEDATALFEGRHLMAATFARRPVA